MTEEEIRAARKLIESIKLDPWWGPDAGAYFRVGDIRLLIFCLERALWHIEESRCRFELGEDWG